MLSQELSILYSMGSAHSRTARGRWRTRRALEAFPCRIGARISSRSALPTSETGILPMRRQRSAVGASRAGSGRQPGARPWDSACERRGSTCGFGNGGDHAPLVALQGHSVDLCGDGHILDGETQGFEQM